MIEATEEISKPSASLWVGWSSVYLAQFAFLLFEDTGVNLAFCLIYYPLLIAGVLGALITLRRREDSPSAMILLLISILLMGSFALGQLKPWHMESEHPPREAIRSTLTSP